MYVSSRFLLAVLFATAIAGCHRPGPRISPAAAAPPSVGLAEALASSLEVGMPENNVQRFLNGHGVPCHMSLGCSHSWTRFGELTNGCNLALEMLPTGFLGGGRLQAAYIQSNGVNIAQLSSEFTADHRPCTMKSTHSLSRKMAGVGEKAPLGGPISVPTKS